MMGWNLAQNVDGTTAGTRSAPASGSVTVTFTNPDNAEVRLVIGATGVSWCSPVTSGVPVPWSAFVTNCWVGGSPQEPVAPGAGIQDLTLTVVGTNSTSVPFDICLQDITLQ
jgi:hypothetical protein